MNDKLSAFIIIYNSQSPVPSPQSLVTRPYASWVALPLNLSCAGLGF
ncbi:hypothetical protein [Sphaerospermopsis sp. FACHB-1194]|nr:hypothetical protein [Sphaerospermopsis sp. FACHB-1194]MBD2144456.1 hypothetical protein [Sphaerospermopsis sp. FACHB-1194]